MGAISIGLPRGGSPVQLDGSSLQNGECHVVCFLSHCNGLPANSLHHCGIVCRDCEIRRRHGTRACQTITLTSPAFWHGVLEQPLKFEIFEIRIVSSGN